MFPPDLDASRYEAVPPVKRAIEQPLISVQQLCEEINWSEAMQACEQHFTELLPKTFVRFFVLLLIGVLVARFVVATVKGTVALLITLVKTCLIAYILAIMLYLVDKMVN
ncbi:uncharacterized protein FFB20_09111 [Fusarium fujikuroi]|uniref:Uncharacterized protein n=1 Tax=Fusarium fujikuroi TaxID=5127 RepID=A0A2H3T1B5_FUSFU|nr:uncharacterized protein Y057_8474 [Fusarium fujikuroi]KLP18858.1 uncharacterized protein LW94_838 [Fusarium fujikuroi]QGI71363.1 hypothetical protein CEK27_003692 [Fusarium fujikuroi]QGJ02256.1 hypothetical protein CEK26_003700 [Fusarium fujikuroi]SCN91972.1 uncharacterized protein FFB20_09111 [Fusarium fujikuroi]